MDAGEMIDSLECVSMMDMDLMGHLPVFPAFDGTGLILFAFNKEQVKLEKINYKIHTRKWC